MVYYRAGGKAGSCWADSDGVVALSVEPDAPPTTRKGRRAPVCELSMGVCGGLGGVERWDDRAHRC